MFSLFREGVCMVQAGIIYLIGLTGVTKFVFIFSVVRRKYLPL